MPMLTFLHVGCGPHRKPQTTRAFAGPGWNEVRLDSDPSVTPDVIGSLLDMSAVAVASVDAIYSRHNIEYLYPHEVPLALAEFRRVLKPDGFAVIACTDLQSVAAMIAEDRLTEITRETPDGPITPLDLVYGFRPALAQGHLHRARRCGFTQKVLSGTLMAAGFGGVAHARRAAPHFDLWALASMVSMSDASLRTLAVAHFPAR